MAPSLEGDFNPAVHFLGLIQKALSDGIARQCGLASGPKLIIAPQQSAYYGTGDVSALQALCLAAPFDLQIEALPDWNPKAKTETIQVGRMRIKAQADSRLAGLSMKPLNELLWLAALAASNGRLLQGCRADEPVRLKHLPDFAHLPHQKIHLKLAHAMAESSADLLTVAKRTGIPLAQVYDFHNACVALKLIERGSVFDPEEYFLGLALKSLHDGLMRRCVLPHLPPVFLAPQERRYYCQTGSAGLEPFYSANLADLQVDVVATLDGGGDDEEEVIQIGRMRVRRKKEGQTPRLESGPLEDLLWNAALQTSRGRLLAGKRGSDVVRLKRWPDFSRLSRDRRLLPLAAFMSVNATDLSSIAKYTGAPLPQVVDFHNACAVLDFLEYLPEERLHKRPVSDKDKATYRTISRSLGGIRASEHAR